MLGKLFKYEVKSRYKIQLGLMIAMLINASIITGIVYLMNNLGSNLFFNLLNSLSVLAFVAIIIATVAHFMIGSIIDYKDRMLGDEAFLTHTLPVKPNALLAAKFIYDILNTIAIIIVIYLSMAIILRNIEWITLLKSFFISGNADDLYFKDAFTIGGAIYTLFSIVVGSLFALGSFYTSMAIGFSYSTGKGLKSVLTYIIIYFINQFLSIAVMLVTLVMKAGSVKKVFTDGSLLNSTEAYNTIMISSLVLSVVIVVVFYLIQNHMLSKKLSLQ